MTIITYYLSWFLWASNLEVAQWEVAQEVDWGVSHLKNFLELGGPLPRQFAHSHHWLASWCWLLVGGLGSPLGDPLQRAA